MSGELEPARLVGADLLRWSEEARAVHAIALSLSETAFVPPSMRGRPSEITGCVLAGRELGLSPLAALRSVDIIDGTPAIRAVALRGLVQAHGHEIYLVESTETRCVMRGRRKGEPHVQTSTWTIERARKAGLAGKKNWQNHPAAMLIARATAELARLIAADVLVALPLVVEELSDEVSSDAIAEAPAASSKPAKRTAQRKALPAPAPPPPDLPAVVPYVDDAANAETVQAPPLEDPMTDGMRRALMAAYREVGITDRDERLAHAARIVGRPLRSANELSHGEAHELLAALEALAVRAEQDSQAEESQ